MAVQPRTRECQFRRFAPPPGKSIATPPYSHSPQPGHVSMGLAEKRLRSEGCAVQASFADRLATKLSVLIELDTVNSALPAPTRSCCAHRAAVSSSAFCLLVLQHCTLVGSIFRFYLVHVMYAVFATKPRAHARVRGASYGIGRRVSSTMHALVGTERTVPPCRCFGTTSCTGARERARICICRVNRALSIARFASSAHSLAFHKISQIVPGVRTSCVTNDLICK